MNQNIYKYSQDQLETIPVIEADGTVSRSVWDSGLEGCGRIAFFHPYYLHYRKLYTVLCILKSCIQIYSICGCHKYSRFCPARILKPCYDELSLVRKSMLVRLQAESKVIPGNGFPSLQQWDPHGIVYSNKTKTDRATDKPSLESARHLSKARLVFREWHYKQKEAYLT